MSNDKSMTAVDVLAVLRNLAHFVNSQTETHDDGAHALLAPVGDAEKALKEAMATLKYVAAFDGQSLTPEQFAVIAKRARAALARATGAQS